MSRTTFVRRLTAVITLLALLCLAVPATAATPGSHHPKSPTVSSTSVFDQLIAWLSSLGFGPASSSNSRTTSTLAKSSASLSVPSAGRNTDSTDVSIGVDPNGHQ